MDSKQPRLRSKIAKVLENWALFEPLLIVVCLRISGIVTLCQKYIIEKFKKPPGTRKTVLIKNYSMERKFSRELFYLSLIDLFKDCFAGDMELQEGGHGWEFKVKKDQRVTRIKADVNIVL